MNSTFDRYFETFSTMSEEALQDRYDELYGIHSFVDLGDDELNAAVAEELWALERYLGIGDCAEDEDELDWQDLFDEYRDEIIARAEEMREFDEYEEAAWHDTCDYEEAKDEELPF